MPRTVVPPGVLVISPARRTNHSPKFSISITLIAASMADRDRVRSLLRKTAWRLIDFDSLEEATSPERRALTPIILCDLNLNGRPWPQTLRALRAARTRACVIFLADDCPDAMRDELMRLGAFDVLTRPLDRHGLLLTLLFAYSHCKANWPTKSPKRSQATASCAKFQSQGAD